MKILVCDTETTGVEEPIGVVEVSWVEVLFNEELAEYYLGEPTTYQVNPELHIPCDAAGIHGIRNEDITDELPKLSDVDFPKDEIIFVAHNSSFDRPVLEPYLNIKAELCTMLLSRRLFPYAPNHKLSTMACHCNLSRQLSHRAESDVATTGELLIHIVTKYNLTIEQLLEYFNKPWVHRFMPFGKHKGELMSDVPRSYLYWLQKQDLDKDMKTTVDWWLKTN